MDIGSKGLAEVNLIIPQSTSLTFDIDHTDENGDAIDHTGSTVHMAFQSKDMKTTHDYSQYCTGTTTGIHVAIPASVSDELPVGKSFVWDMIVSTSTGENIRMAYGSVTIVDTYAMDE